MEGSLISIVTKSLPIIAACRVEPSFSLKDVHHKTTPANASSLKIVISGKGEENAFSRVSFWFDVKHYTSVKNVYVNLLPQSVKYYTSIKPEEMHFPLQ